MKTALYQIRIDPQEKQETFAVFDELGITPAQAVRLFFAQVRRTHAIPFPIEYTPNDTTAKLLLSDDQDKNYQRFDSLDALFADLKD